MFKGTRKSEDRSLSGRYIVRSSVYSTSSANELLQNWLGEHRCRVSFDIVVTPTYGTEGCDSLLAGRQVMEFASAQVD